MRLIHEDWRMIEGNAGEDVIQSPDAWLECTYDSAFRMYVHVLGITNCSLVMDTALGTEGPWASTALSYSDVGVHCDTISETPTAFYGRFLRWRIDAPLSGDWMICFQMKVEPLTPAENNRDYSTTEV
jgi:hypothetical protein